MAIQDFTAGQVLTAAQMDSLQANDYNQTVSTKTASYTLVAADKGTRVVMNSASATTITVNTSLFSAGDTLFIQNISTGVCTVTAGTATVSSAGSLAIPQNGSGILYFTSAGVSIFYPSAGAATSSGLTLISTTTIGTTVSSVTVTGAFSSTYDNYKITLSGGVSSASNIEIGMILGSTTTGYYRFLIFGSYVSNTVNGSASANVSSWAHAGNATTSMLNAEIELYGPNLAKKTVIVGRNSSTDTGQSGVWQNGFLNDSTQYTAFTLSPASGTLTGGTIRVYGYQNS
jgi:hypothetical protein